MCSFTYTNSSTFHFLTKAGQGRKKLKFLTKLLKAAANEKRLQILRVLLKHRTMEIGDVAQALNLPYKTTARNLKILERYDFLESNFNNGTVYYTLKDSSKLYFNHVILDMIKKRSS